MPNRVGEAGKTQKVRDLSLRWVFGGGGGASAGGGIVLVLRGMCVFGDKKKSEGGGDEGGENAASINSFVAQREVLGTPDTKPVLAKKETALGIVSDTK